MAVPCVGIFFKEQKKAFFLFTEQEIKGKNLGFGIEKGRITVQYPSNRGLAYRYVLSPEPNADKGVSVTYGEKIESPLLIRTFDCESITQFFEIFFENRTDIQIRERYSDYLRYVMNFGERNAQMYVVKKYGISRQRVSDMVSIYNKKLKKEWDL